MFIQTHSSESNHLNRESIQDWIVLILDSISSVYDLIEQRFLKLVMVQFMFE